MLCELCGQKNATSIFMPPDENKLKYLCGQCYKKLNKDSDLENFVYAATQSCEMDSKCNCCGLSFDELKKTKQFGCENCYKVFKTEVANFLSNFKEQKY